jgi:hypothetical protein
VPIQCVLNFLSSGIMECWPPARRAYASERTREYWVVRVEKTISIRQIPLNPSFHHSNWGEAPKLKRGDIKNEIGRF